MTMPMPPGQQLVAADRWPVVGERAPMSQPDTWQVEAVGAVRQPRSWTMAELRQLDVQERTIDIHCVTRWSKPGVAFTGVLLEAVLRQVEPTPDARFVSFVAHSERTHSTSLPLTTAIELGTMIAFAAAGEELPVEHGGPVRVVVPGRYFYKSLKWLHRLELLTEDRLGYWEAEAGYHNVADPWQEQRYIAEGISKQRAAELIAGKDLSHLDLLNFYLPDSDLRGLRAVRAALRHADFRRCDLRQAIFDEANLSNARFGEAKLGATSFVNADLEGADFSGADLADADLRGASLFGATFYCPESGRMASVNRHTQIEEAAMDQLVEVQALSLRQALRRATK